MPRVVNELIQSLNLDPQYLAQKRLKKHLSYRIHVFTTHHMLPDFFESVRKEFSSSLCFYHPGFKYFPPLDFDFIFVSFIYHSRFKEMVLPTARTVANGDPSAVFIVVQEFGSMVAQNFNVNLEVLKRLIYISVVRLIFGIAYTLSSELNLFQDENIRFLLIANVFSRRIFSSLKLNEISKQKFDVSHSIVQVWGSLQIDSLKNLELLSNPIDLLIRINCIIFKIADLFMIEKNNLLVSDICILFSCALSATPPVNTISIHRYLVKWNNFQLAPFSSAILEIFQKSIDQILELAK